MSRYNYPDKDDAITYSMINDIEYSEGYWSGSENRIIQIIKKHIHGLQGSFLDVGYGEGRMLKTFQSLFSTLEGIEPDFYRYSHCRNFVRQHTWAQKTNISNLSLDEYLPDRKFDFILSSHVLQHIPTYKVKKFVADLAALAKDKGYIAILTCHSNRESSYYYLSSRDADNNSIENEADETEFNETITKPGWLPIHFFTIDELHAVCHECGLSIVETQVFHVAKNEGLKIENVDEYINSSSELKNRYGRDIMLLLKKN